MMSADIKGGIDYALLKEHYDCDDYVAIRHPTTGAVLLNGIPFTADSTFYISGLCAYLADVNAVDAASGWTIYTHGQPNPPGYLAALLAAFGVVWPAAVPAFEAKRTTFLATQNCWVHFVGRTRQSQFIPAGTLAAGPYFTWKRRWFELWVERVTVDGTLYVWIEG